MSSPVQPPPLNAPGAVSPQIGIQAGVSTGVIVAQVIIISGGTVHGVYVYNGTPGPGNGPIAWMSSGSVDPYGNPITPGLGATAGAIEGSVLTAGSVPASAVDFTATDIGGITTYVGPTQPVGANNGSLWIDTASGNAIYQLTSGTWSLYQFGSGSIAANSISAAQIVANTITATQLAAGIVYAGIINGTTVNAATFTGSTFQGTDFTITTSGITFQGSGGSSLVIVPDISTFASITFNSGWSHEISGAALYSGLVGSGSGEASAIQFFGPSISSGDIVSIEMLSGQTGGAKAYGSVFYGSNTVLTWSSETGVWNDISGELISGWSVNRARVRLNPDYSCDLDINDLVPPASPPGDGTKIWPAFSLPTWCTPANTIPPNACHTTGTAGTETPALSPRTDGSIEVFGVGGTSVNRMDLSLHYPLN